MSPRWLARSVEARWALERVEGRSYGGAMLLSLLEHVTVTAISWRRNITLVFYLGEY